MAHILSANPQNSRGRLHKEFNEETKRTPFERDRDRIIHSNSFRKLKHKTQARLRPKRPEPSARQATKS